MKTTNDCKPKKLAEGVLVIGFLSAALGLAGCQQQEGIVEKAGKKIDRAAEKASQKIDAAKESLDQKASKAGEYIDDSMITAKVKAAILNDPFLNASKIEVTTVNGIVKLSGTVDSEQNIGRAVDLANSQENVKSVATDLIVKAPGNE